MFVRLVQGNVPQSEKFDPQLIQRGIASYMQLAALPPKEADGAPDLIVLPETVIPLFQDAIAPQLWQQWLDTARERDARILLRVSLRDRVDGKERHRSEEPTSELQSLISISYPVFSLQTKKQHTIN